VTDTAQLTVTAGPSGVRAARRTTTAALRGYPASVVADAELVVTELVTNALLHGVPPVTLRLGGDGKSVRIEVEDAGPAMPLRMRRSSDAMTGRGLDLVATLAHSWGVSPARSGKLVWAELVPGRHKTSSRRTKSAIDSLRPRRGRQDSEPHFPVRLGQVPTELLIAAKAHVDNIIRELILIESSPVPGPRLLSETVRHLAEGAEDFSEARLEIKRQALAAARLGKPFTDLTLSLPLSSADAGLRYLAALDEADVEARAARLLTVAPPPSHRVFREWYVRAIVVQLRAAATGRQGPAPMPFSMALAAELDRVAATPIETPRRVRSARKAAESA
jgi:anti-sigma regulatory factor (Ser/Thr protein kinase)